MPLAHQMSLASSHGVRGEGQWWSAAYEGREGGVGLKHVIGFSKNGERLLHVGL
jgi:hypothetical protein